MTVKSVKMRCTNVTNVNGAFTALQGLQGLEDKYAMAMDLIHLNNQIK